MSRIVIFRITSWVKRLNDMLHYLLCFQTLLNFI